MVAVLRVCCLGRHFAALFGRVGWGKVGKRRGASSGSSLSYATSGGGSLLIQLFSATEVALSAFVVALSLHRTARGDISGAPVQRDTRAGGKR